jgi:glycosyltransferase involved in cell wall biosynthesis
MMRIAMLVLNVVGKGTYWRALALGKELITLGHEVTLLATSPGRRRGFEVGSVQGVTLVETPDLYQGRLRSGWDLWNAAARIRWLHSRKFDIVHAFEARPVVLFPSLYLQRVRHIPLVMDWCDWFGWGGSVEERANPVIRTILGPVETFFERVPRPWADGTTVINAVLQHQAISLGINPESILLLPNGSNVREILPGDRSEARHQLGLGETWKLIAYTGTIFRRDADLMASAFDRIHQAQPDARLLLIGYCNVAVEELVRDPSAVIRTGPVDYRTLIHHLVASDLCWLPLRDSGANRGRSPLKLNDYLAAGRAIVATHVGAVGELLRWESVGRLVADEPGPLAEAVLDLLNDDIERERLARHARQVAEEKLSWSLVAGRLERFYRELLESSREGNTLHRLPV